jgi:hypothetical protein
MPLENTVSNFKMEVHETEQKVQEERRNKEEEMKETRQRKEIRT